MTLFDIILSILFYPTAIILLELGIDIAARVLGLFIDFCHWVNQ